jgi:hypothetical protein
MSVNQLDATTLKETGDALVKKIAEIVNTKDMFIYQPIPSELLLTDAQFRSMANADALQDIMRMSPITGQMELTKGKLFYTGDYVLEVKIK